MHKLVWKLKKEEGNGEGRHMQHGQSTHTSESEHAEIIKFIALDVFAGM